MERTANEPVGRERELEQLARAVQRLEAGEGGLVLLFGEAGMGKSCLAECVAQLAARRGVRNVWGRCLEAGGAPPFWPWTQVLRALRREGVLTAAAANPVAGLGQIVPELGGHVATPSSSLDPEQARFRLLDTICAMLLDVVSLAPRLLVLEDIHFADASSLALLEVLAAQLRGHPLLVVGTLRHTDAAACGHFEWLRRLTGLGQSIELLPFSRRAAAEFVERAAGAELPRDLVDRLYDITEGHPLFLSEMTRLIAAPPSTRGLRATTASWAATLDLTQLPNTVTSVIQHRLRLLDPETLSLLRAGSVLGREFSLALLAQLTERDSSECSERMHAVLDAAIVQLVSHDRYRFGHLLIREVLYQELPADLREAYHRRAAASLESIAGAPRAALLHHLLRGGASVARRAVEIGGEVGAAELQQLAFAEAVETYEHCLVSLDKFLPEATRLRFELTLGLGRAQLALGRVDQGRRTCAQAASLAERLAEPELFAEAALVYGSVVVLAEVDPEMVALLTRALDQLPNADAPLRAKVMARLANAKQPAPDPREGFDLARAAIAMARRLGDPLALLDALREGVGALMDLASPAERRELNEEHCRIAEQRRDLVEEFRARSRLQFDLYELGEMALVSGQIRRLALIAARLEHPYYAWQATTFAVAERALLGHVHEAERLLEQARRTKGQARDPNADRVLATLGLYVARAGGDRGRVLSALDAVGLYFGDNVLGRILLVAERCELGVPESETATLEPSAVEWSLSAGDLSVMEDLARIARARRDRAMAQRLYDLVLPNRQRWVSGGQATRMLQPAAELTLGRLAMTLERFELSAEHLEQALLLARRAAAITHELMIGNDYAEALALLRRSRERSELLVGLHRVAREHGLAAWVERIEGLETAAARATEPADATRASVGPLEPMVFQMTLSGDVWSFARRERSFQLKDNKGLRIIHRLILEPGRDFHVLDLSGASGFIDNGAIVGLDAEARRQFKGRLKELEAEMEEAEGNHDMGRVELLRRESDELTRELSRAYGLGGRTRPSGAAAERARVNVQRRVRDAISRIEKQDETLGRYLRWTIKTGAYCRYEPG